MSDIVSADLEITLQETGGNSNTWGSVLNDTLTTIEEAIVDEETISVTVANVVLTSDQNGKATLRTSGILTANREVHVRAAQKEWNFYNGCTGSFTLTLKTVAGTGIVVPASKWVRARCNGTNVEKVDFVPTTFADGSIATAAIADLAITSAKLAGEITAFPTGSRIGYVGATEPSGWVFGDGRTIGNATSGSNRANADTSALFELLWTAYANTELAILTSAGAVSSRGASAAADYAASKRMPVPDYSGRAAFGKDDMSGSSKNRITNQTNGWNGDTMGGAGGEETHISTAAQSGVPAHTHTGPSHTHTGSITLRSISNIQSGGGKEGLVAHDETSFTGTDANSFTTDAGGTGVTGSNATASGAAHNNLPPGITECCIIKL